MSTPQTIPQDAAERLKSSDSVKERERITSRLHDAIDTLILHTDTPRELILCYLMLDNTLRINHQFLARKALKEMGKTEDDFLGLTPEELQVWKVNLSAFAGELVDEALENILRCLEDPFAYLED